MRTDRQGEYTIGMIDASFCRNPHYRDRLAFFATDAQEEADLLFLGDSLVERYDLAEYFPEMRAVNRGIDGDTVSFALDRLDISLNVASPTSVALLLGINDLEDAARNYARLLRFVRQRYPKARILVLSLLPVGEAYASMNEPAQNVNGILRAAAKEIGAEYLDVRGALADEEGTLEEENTVDGIHLTPLGYRKLTEAIRRYR